jgi:o-succinylbenzoate---CoA ligase
VIFFRYTPIDELWIFTVGMNIWKINSQKLASTTAPQDPYLSGAYDFLRRWQAGKPEFILRTSGSTGTPKPIHLTLTQMEASARMTGQALQLPAGTQALVCLNVGYIAGTMMLVRGMVLGWELTIIEPVANPLLGFGEDTRFDFIAMVPLQLQACLQNPDTRLAVERVGKILLGGAPVSLALEKEIQALSVPVYQSYGMTETVSHVALRRLNGPDPEADYRVLEGVEFGVDAQNCIYVKGAVTNFEKIQTNDLVEIASPRTFRWVGRRDAIINSGGLKIELPRIDRKVEESLLEMGISIGEGFFSWYENDERLGQKLILFVEGKEGNLPVAPLLDRLRAKVSTFEVPKAIYFVERFKRTPTDKLDKIATANTYFNP